MSTQAPTFTQPLQSVVALEGSAATFEAQVSGKSKFYRQTQLSSTFLMHGPRVTKKKHQQVDYNIKVTGCSPFRGLLFVQTVCSSPSSETDEQVEHKLA